MTDEPTESEEAGSSALAPRKKKKARVAPVEEASREPDEVPPEATGKSWSTAQLLIALVVGLAVGGFGGYTARAKSKTGATAASEAAPVETVQGPRLDPSAAVAPAAPGADKFGRPPGDEHFGHDHPPQQGAPPAAPAAAPAPGPDGKDSFGRAAGHEHFGHNHQ